MNRMNNIKYPLVWVVVFILDVAGASSPADQHMYYSSQSHPLDPSLSSSRLSTEQEQDLVLRNGRARIVTPESADDDYLFPNLDFCGDSGRNSRNNGQDDTLHLSPQGLFQNYNTKFKRGREEKQEEQEGIRLTIQTEPHPNYKSFSSPSFSSSEIATHDNIGLQNSVDKSNLLKTGTTIVGIQTRDAIILAADTRATEGSIVADTQCEKVHQLSRNVWCCGAGTSADLDALTRKVRYTFLLRDKIMLNIGNDHWDHDNGNNEEPFFRGEEEADIRQTLGKTSISSMCNMIREELYKNGGEIGANLVLGGVDQFTNRPILTAIHPHGSIDVVPYTALGSGGLAAMGVLESRYDTDMTLDEGIELVKDAVISGIKNDLGSGSQVDICIIESNGGVTYKRGVVAEELLKLSKGDKDMDNRLYERQMMERDVEMMAGVNGFASLPYKISNPKVVIASEDTVEERSKKWLNDLIRN